MFLSGGYVIILALAGVLTIVLLKKRGAWLLTFCVRLFLGMFSIYLVNQFLMWQQINVQVGLNPYTALTSGILGFPGVLLLYAVQFYSFL